MTVETWNVPSFDKYYMDIAESVSKRANCLGKKVGAIVVVSNRIVSTGYNGVPEGMTNCMDRGCAVCLWKKKARDKTKGYKDKRKGSGKRYDDCICVHAEQNALMTAARVGIPLEGGSVYTVYQPCFGCIKQMLQAKIRRVVFKNELIPSDRRLLKPYQDIQDEFPELGVPLEARERERICTLPLSCYAAMPSRVEQGLPQENTSVAPQKKGVYPRGREIPNLIDPPHPSPLPEGEGI